MKGVFVTGTDTGVGKTIVTGLLGRYLSDKGYKAVTQKWVETGCGDAAGSDIKLHLKIMRRSPREAQGYSRHILPYAFKRPCSPHLASRIEKRPIRSEKIIKSFRILSGEFDFVIVEGAGGALVPFNKKSLLVDIAKELNLPVLVVAQNRLGAINHTLLTIEALKKRRMNILGIIFNNCRREDKRVTQDNPLIVKALGKEEVFGVLPWREERDKLYANFLPLGKKIYKSLRI